MTVPRTITLLVDLKLLDSAAHDGKYQLVSDGMVYALVRWIEGEWTYPGGALLEFGPTHYRPFTAALRPEGSDG